MGVVMIRGLHRIRIGLLGERGETELENPEMEPSAGRKSNSPHHPQPKISTAAETSQ